MPTSCLAISLLLAVDALKYSGDSLPDAKDNNTVEVETWYINVKGARERQDCMEAQLTNMGITPHRFQALSELDADCTAGGVNKKYMSDYNDRTKRLDNNKGTRFAVISDWCSHKRLMSQFYNSSSTAEYMVMLEDDAVLNDLKYTEKINEFIAKYKGKFKENWQMVQLDPFGSSCRFHEVGRVGGKTVFKPQSLWKQAPGMIEPEKDSLECAQYYGSQAYLVRRSQIPSIIENMESQPTVPLDWLPAQLPRGLAWKGGLAFNSRSYHQTGGYTAACGKKHFKSSIAKGGGSNTNDEVNNEELSLGDLMGMGKAPTSKDIGSVKSMVGNFLRR